MPVAVTRGTALLLLALLVSGATVRSASARDNSILILGKNALYGGATGLLLGAALSLVLDSGDRGAALRWGAVIGTFGGFAYGIHELTREDHGFSSSPDPVRRGMDDPLLGDSGVEIPTPGPLLGRTPPVFSPESAQAYPPAGEAFAGSVSPVFGRRAR